MVGSSNPQPQTTSTSTTTVAPFEGQKPYLETLFKEAENQYKASGPTYFPDQTFAPLDPLQKQAQSQLLTASAGPIQTLVNKGAAANSFLQGPVLSPENNPALQQHAQYAVAPIYDNLVHRTLPAVRNEATANSGYGGSRQGIAEGLAISSANREAGSTTANIYNQAYQNGLNAMVQGQQLLPTIAQAQTLPAAITEAVGGQERALYQASIDEAIERHNFEQSIDQAKLAQFGNLIRGNYGGTTTQIAGGAQGSSSAFSQVLGAGALGLGLFSSLNNPESVINFAS